MAAPKTSGPWSIADFQSASKIEGLMIETQANGRKVLVSFADLVSAIQGATGTLPLPSEPGTYLLKVEVENGKTSYSYESTNVLTYQE